MPALSAAVTAQSQTDASQSVAYPGVSEEDANAYRSEVLNMGYTQQIYSSDYVGGFSCGYQNQQGNLITLSYAQGGGVLVAVWKAA